MSKTGNIVNNQLYISRAMLTSQNGKIVTVTKLSPPVSEEELLKQKRMNDVLLLLESLVDREEATVKLILDCLYDVGSLNLINKKFQKRYLNRIMKSIARLSKPAFKIVAFYWFRKNCPQLITNWLGTKVRFGSSRQ